ncbi:MAG: hypothetical protein ACYC6M_02965 [Terriglobales bacterium]
MARKPINEVDAKLLRYAGILGHTYAVIYADAAGERHVGVETCDKANALRAVFDWYAGQDAAVYNQIARGKWRLVPFRRRVETESPEQATRRMDIEDRTARELEDEDSEASGA